MRRVSWLVSAALILTGSPAAATSMDNLLLALKRARALAARGHVEVTVNFPPQASPARRAAQLPAVPFRPALIARNFTVSRAVPESVADRAVTRYDLTPHNATAGHWTLWVDSAWNVPLAFEERLADGTLARRASFTKVNPTPAKVTRPVPALPAGLRGALMRALPGLRLPPGFVPVDVQRQDLRWTVTLSDGLNVLALVAAPRGVQVAPGVASRKVGVQWLWLVGTLPQSALHEALSRVQQVNPETLGTFVTPADSNP
ncbi:hypothetical protein DEDE109153_12695 [Deinococcus deserti]|uniref:Sigma E regulatory protein, MucB/RseB n=1 Tax=Deinococcus deserti (strain DSM 17065 / CIP 109153 / LMG 22923 / VCD115) TaxID=546414 RepID=C1CXQ6_DEIDV|nr:hypothetical protein [Deinococcus deserti]ACO44862.1 Conserved hypothetical protein, precursor [Deinococcus deserti VCD115]